MKYKYNKITFAVLSFIIASGFLMNWGTQAIEWAASGYSGAASLFVALVFARLPLLVGALALLYLAKYLIEIKVKREKLGHVLNISRAALGVAVIVLFVLRTYIASVYTLASYACAVLIAATAAVEIVRAYSKPKKKK